MPEIATFLAIFLGIPLAITLATPVRYLGYFLLWLAMLGVLTDIWPRGSDHSSPLSGTDAAIESFVLGFYASFIFLKWAFVHLWRAFRPEATSEEQPEARKPDGFSLLLTAVTGLFTAPWSIFVIALARSEDSSALLTHVSPLLVPVVAGLLLSRSARSTRPLLQTFAGALLSSSAITLAMAAIYVAARITSVIDRGEAVADGNPYCIQIDTAHAGYRQAMTRLDLSPLMMRAHCNEGWCFANHGILVIDTGAERRLMNWSYRHDDFKDNILDLRNNHPPPIVCKPERGFARNLPRL